MYTMPQPNKPAVPPGDSLDALRGIVEEAQRREPVRANASAASASTSSSASTASKSVRADGDVSSFDASHRLMRLTLTLLPPRSRRRRW